MEGEVEGEAEVEGDLPVDPNLELVDESTEEQLAQTAVTTEGAELDEHSAAALLSQAQNTTAAAGELLGFDAWF